MTTVKTKQYDVLEASFTYTQLTLAFILTNFFVSTYIT